MRRGCAILLLGLGIAGCRPAMEDEGRIKPLQESSFFADGGTARQPVAGTVARGALKENSAFWQGEEAGRLVMTFPQPVTLERLERGRERFEIFCAVCHGRTGAGDGMIVQRGFPAPPTLHQERLRNAPPGYLFGVMTRGYGVMASYADRVPAEDRWAIAAYIRALQLSQDARLDDVPPENREALEKR